MSSIAPIGLSWIWAFSINAFLVAIAQRFPLLTPLGWIHAAALGTILLGCIGWQAWGSVIIYLLLGSFVTRLGMTWKQSAGLAEGRGGRRGPENLWGSAGTGALLAILYKTGIGSGEILLVGFAASFAAKLADTFGSEIGKRWGTKTYLITSLKLVPPGTDGGISIQGTFASILGSFLMTSSIVIISLVTYMPYAIIIFLVGFFATILESLLGAIAQKKYKFLTNEVVNFIQTTMAAGLAITILTLFKF